MIPDLARLLGLRDRPAGREWRQAVPSRALYVNQGLWCQPVPLLQPHRSFRQQIGPERRVKERDVEGSFGTSPPARSAVRQEAHSVHLLHIPACSTPLGEPRAQLSDRGSVTLDKSDVRGTPRKRFQAERAAPGK